MSNEFDKLNRQVSFMEPHIGGNLNDSNTEFISQKDIIQSKNNLYLDLLDDTNNLSRDKDIQNNNNKSTNKSSEYIQEKRKEYSNIILNNTHQNYMYHSNKLLLI